MAGSEAAAREEEDAALAAQLNEVEGRGALSRRMTLGAKRPRRRR
jgi:hypothetical protein